MIPQGLVLPVSVFDEALLWFHGSTAEVAGWDAHLTQIRSDGTCECCGEVLEPNGITDLQRERLLANLAIVTDSDFAARSKNLPKRLNHQVPTQQFKVKTLRQFAAWCDSRGRVNPTVVIDGMNIGYTRGKVVGLPFFRDPFSGGSMGRGSKGNHHFNGMWSVEKLIAAVDHYTAANEEVIAIIRSHTVRELQQYTHIHDKLQRRIKVR